MPGSKTSPIRTSQIAKVVCAIAIIGLRGAAGGNQKSPGQQAGAADVAFAPNVPPPLTRSKASRVVVNLEVTEENRELARGVVYNFWMYNGHVPGPFVRVRVGDTVEVHLKNRSSDKAHTVDFHFVSGPGGGASVLMAKPGQESAGEFKALKPGLFIYHCAANPMPAHMASGLYGLVLVEPEGGLPRADREFYVMQSEFYTEGAVGKVGLQAYSSRKAAAEAPEYIVFNGNASSLMGKGALNARVGETVRIYFGNIGPNKISSVHLIGAIFDRVYREGGLMDPAHNIQTTLVPPGGASILELQPQVPGDYTLLDHAMFRIDRGAMGILRVEGPSSPDIYRKVK